MAFTPETPWGPSALGSTSSAAPATAKGSRAPAAAKASFTARIRLLLGSVVGLAGEDHEHRPSLWTRHDDR